MLYDISPPLDERLKVWPGDTPLSRSVLLDMAKGANITLSTLRATVHLGAHADAPNHYGKDAVAIDRRPLDLYLGPCQVVHVNVPTSSRVQWADIKRGIESERVLIRTATYSLAPDAPADNFAALEPELVDRLHELGVRLIGIDTPSVDLFESIDLPAHLAFLRHDMAILEGIDLSQVPEGIYELIALPLKLVGFDASPVRAVLRPLGSK